MNRMLASVRDIAEAARALTAQVDWIDVKEPSAGALGAAAPATVRAIVDLVAGRIPVSATIGDCWDDPAAIPAGVASMADSGVDYIKAGLRARRVSHETVAMLRAAASAEPGLIVVCMAELAPLPADIEKLAAAGIAGLMLDTADKRGGRLTEVVSHGDLRAFVELTQAHGLLCGLAGRLARGDIERLSTLQADYLGFRSALCEHGGRTRVLCDEALTDIRAEMRRHAGATLTQMTGEVT